MESKLILYCYQVPSDVASLFDLPPLPHPAYANESAEPSTAFHTLLKALRLFVESPEGPGALPLSPTLPDMKTDTESYVKLQRMYKEQARIETVSDAFVELFVGY